MGWNAILWIVVVVCATIIICKIIDESAWEMFNNAAELKKLEDSVRLIEDRIDGKM